MNWHIVFDLLASASAFVMTVIVYRWRLERADQEPVATFSTGYAVALVLGAALGGFGLGTLPAMLLTGSVYQQFRHRLGQRSWQNAGGMVFSLAGLLMLTAPLWVSQEFVRDYPILTNGLFCLT